MELIYIYSRDRGIYQLQEKSRKTDYKLLEGFISLIPEQKVFPKYLYVHSDGRLILNSTLNREIKSREIEIKINNNCRKIALIPNGDKNHRFTKNGTTRNVQLVRILTTKKIQIPAAFKMELDTESGVWIGELDKNIKRVNKCPVKTPVVE